MCSVFVGSFVALFGPQHFTLCLLLSTHLLSVAMPTARAGHVIGRYLAPRLPIDVDSSHPLYFDMWEEWFDSVRLVLSLRCCSQLWWRIMLVPPHANRMYASFLVEFNSYLRHINRLNWDSDGGTFHD